MKQKPKLRLMQFEKQFVLSKAKRITLMGGRGCGKSHAIQARMKWLTTRFSKFRYLYVTPLAVQHDEVYNEMISDPDFRRYIKGKPRNRPYCKIKLKNGSQIWMRSCKIWDALRSTGEDEICIDESQDAGVIESKVKQVLFPMIGRRISPAGGRGVMVFAGQFRGEDWRYEYWLKGQPPILKNTGIPSMDGKRNLKSRQPMNESFRVPSSAGYAYQTPGGAEELVTMRAEMLPEVWEQEWECIPRANANAVFKEHEVDMICADRIPPIDVEETPQRGGGYATIIDIGGIVDPEKLIVVHGNDSAGEVVFAKSFPLGRHDKQNAHEAMEIARRFGSSVIIDTTASGGSAANGPREDRVELHRAEAFGMTFHEVYFRSDNKKRMITNLRGAIQEKRFGIAYALKDVASELKTFEYAFNRRTGNYEYRGRDGMHDDYVSCCIMAWEGLQRGWVGARGKGMRNY